MFVIGASSYTALAYYIRSRGRTARRKSGQDDLLDFVADDEDCKRASRRRSVLKASRAKRGREARPRPGDDAPVSQSLMVT